MTETSSLAPPNCVSCNALLPAGALVCKRCHTLVHAAELNQLAEAAKSLEEKNEIGPARDMWQKAAQLLPAESRQAAWVQQQIARLQALPATEQAAPIKPASGWIGKLAPVAIIVFALTKGKTLLALFNAKFLFSLGAFLGVYWSMYGMPFAIGFTAQVLIHELGHYIDIRRRGLPADMPLFLPGLGAFVRWQGMGVSLETRAAISLAGPLAGWLAAAVCAWVWLQTGDGLWGALARTGAWLNLLNLIPVWALDGGQAFLALGKVHRVVVLAACVALLVFTGESVFLLIAFGAAYRLFTKDVPLQPSAPMAAYFIALLLAFGLLKMLIPGEGFSAP